MDELKHKVELDDAKRESLMDLLIEFAPDLCNSTKLLGPFDKAQLEYAKCHAHFLQIAAVNSQGDFQLTCRGKVVSFLLH